MLHILFVFRITIFRAAYDIFYKCRYWTAMRMKFGLYSSLTMGTTWHHHPVTTQLLYGSHQNPVSFVAWSPDDTMLLTCGNGEVLKLWDVETGTCKHTFGEKSPIVSSCAWLPDSKRLVCGSSDPNKCIYMWDLDGNELEAWRGVRMPKVSDLAVTPDGEHLISICSEKDIRIYSYRSKTERVVKEDHPITSLSVSKNSEFLIVNLNSQEIHLWEIVETGNNPLKYTGHKQGKYVIRSCFGGVDCMFIASGSENSQFAPCAASSTHLMEPLGPSFPLTAHVDMVEEWLKAWPKVRGGTFGYKSWRLTPYAVLWVLWKSRNNHVFRKKVISVNRASMEVKALLWFWAPAWLEGTNISSRTSLLIGMMSHSEEDELLRGLTKGTVYIWNRQNQKPLEVLTGHSMTVNCVSWNPTQPQMLASASDDQTIRIWGPSRKK
ncbi:hypothetical protein IFM89_038366 [Coptis chinensis]|uniref:Uncharacterized protein n=1 Tax=Coptis chinensis TaxID=261450 RepID=A0A835IA88_9MAGN|nr:hypothetical protein IFM89_038366 [Coptis chinensis]